MVENVPVVAPKATVGEVINLLSKHANTYASVAYVYLVDAKRVLVGVVSIKEIFVHSHHTMSAAIAKSALHSVSGTTPAEEVALKAIDFNLKAVPVVDEKTGRLLGVVTPDIIRDILHYGRIHDTLATGGVHAFENPRESLLSGTSWLHIRKRMPWLLLGLAGGLLGASIVQMFESSLNGHLLVVAFIPLVVYLADAVGSQTEIIFVRALALDPTLKQSARFRKYFVREITVTGTLSVVLGFLMSLVTIFWFEAPQLVSVLFVSVVSTLLLAMMVALIIPYLATKLDYDPALTSGPVATVIRDVLTLVVYFLVVTALL